MDPATVLHLHFVENRALPLWIEVEGRPGRVRLPVGLAVPVTSLVDGLATVLDLPPGAWALALDGLRLDDSAILADHAPSPDSTLVVQAR